jgi:hypothetical protein
MIDDLCAVAIEVEHPKEDRSRSVKGYNDSMSMSSIRRICIPRCIQNSYGEMAGNLTYPPELPVGNVA